MELVPVAIGERSWRRFRKERIAARILRRQPSTAAKLHRVIGGAVDLPRLILALPDTGEIVSRLDGERSSALRLRDAGNLPAPQQCAGESGRPVIRHFPDPVDHQDMGRIEARWPPEILVVISVVQNVLASRSIVVAL